MQTHQTRRRWAQWLVPMLMLSACDGDGAASAARDGNPESSAEQDASQMDASDDAGELTGVDAGTDPNSPKGACEAYVFAQCKRRAECEEDEEIPAECLANRERCPESMFVDTTYTVASLQACAKSWETFPCDDVRRGITPACTFAGTLEAGALCTTASACVSKICGVGEPFTSCRKCTARAEPDEACSADLVCNEGYRCESGTCALKPVPPRVPFVRAEGEPCDGNRTGSFFCLRNLVCAEDAESTPAAPKYTCREPSALGAKCHVVGYDGSNRTQYACAEGHYCRRSDQTCQPLPGDGELCGVIAGPVSDVGTLCQPESYCSKQSTPTRCVARKAPGEPCALDNDSWVVCNQGAKCICENFADDCAQRTCLRVREAGEKCGGPHDRCEPVAPCTDGLCTFDEQAVNAMCNFP